MTTEGLPHHVAVRMDDTLLARVDALIPVLSTNWHRASRSDVLRACILAGLPVIEKRAAKTPKKGGA